MTESVKLVTFLDLIFIIMLVISGSLGGIASEIVYYFAFIVPVAVGIYASGSLRYKREEERGIADPPDTTLDFDKNRLVRLASLIFPAVTLIFLCSLLTSFVLSLVGASSPTVEEEGIISMLLAHALVPAIFEEALFRYIPIKLLLPYSKRFTVVYSALCFALIHCSLYQIPYAFVAGIIFMLIDVALGSVWPSVILHFINNAASVVSIKYCSDPTASLIFVLALIALSLVSLIFIFRKRKEYKRIFMSSFDGGEKCDLTYAPIALVAITLYLSFLNLFS